MTDQKQSGDMTHLDPGESNSFPEAKDFQVVLNALLAASQPILEEELKRAKSPEQLQDLALACNEELLLANRLCDRFASEKVALAYLPEEARKVLGEPERWRWCLLHIRCCLVFGWLMCRGPSTFKSWSYYLYPYWKCVRQVPGTPVIQRTLDQIDSVTALDSLRVPPGNRLHRLADERAGFHAIRVNDQCRVIFRFEGEHAFDVRCTDYH